MLAIDFEAFFKGKRNFDVLFEPTPRKSLAGFSPTRNRVILNELDNVCNHLYMLTREDGKWKREEMPGSRAVQQRRAHRPSMPTSRTTIS